MAIDILQCFSEKPAELSFVIPGFVIGTVGCIAAAGGTGKSFLALEAGMGVCSNAADIKLLDLGIKDHGKVVILNAEDPKIVLHQRLHAIGTHLSKAVRDEIAEKMLIKALVGTRPNIMENSWQKLILEMSMGTRLVIFDTLTRWHQLDENNNGDMAKVLSVFNMICRETGAAVLFIHHVSKGMAKNGRQNEQQATRGASAITDNARWQGWMQSMTKEEAKSYNITEKNRHLYVAMGGNKENYGQEMTKKWLERTDGGVLLKAKLDKKAPPTRLSAREYD